MPKWPTVSSLRLFDWSKSNIELGKFQRKYLPVLITVLLLFYLKRLENLMFVLFLFLREFVSTSLQTK